MHRIASNLPDCQYCINLCKNRYHFLVLFCATVLSNKVNLLPNNDKLETLKQLKENYPHSAIIDDQWFNRSTPKEQTSYRLPVISTSQMAAIVFTSGSTGAPKPLKKTWGMLSGTAKLLQQRFLIQQNLLVSTVVPQHMYGLETSIFITLEGKNTLFVGNSFYHYDIANALKHHQPVFLITTPVHLNTLLKSHTHLKIKHVVSATAPLSIELCKKAETFWSTKISEIYGFSEAGSIATRQTSVTENWHLLNGMQLLGHELISVSAAHLPQAEPLHDVIEKIDAKTFTLKGRSNDIIDIAGKRISLAGLNQQLITIEGVTDAVVFIPENSLRPAALVVSILSKHQLKQQLSRIMDDVFIPRPLYLVKHIERGPTGKITKANLLEQYHHAANA